MIPVEGSHQIQLAFRSPVRRKSDYDWALNVEANVTYLLTYPNDTPNWGNLADMATISPPCANWYSLVYYVTGPVEYERSQSSGMLAAIQADREKVASILAACAKTDELEISNYAAIQGEPSQDIGILAAILGEAERSLPIRAAVRTERLLEPAIISACAKTDELEISNYAAIQGNPQVHSHLKAAVLGETDKSVGIVAFVVKTRVDHIILEMENLWPQELDLRSTPNWASKVKDYRKSSLSARDS